MKTVNFTNKSFMSWLAMAMLCMFAVNANAQVCSQGSNVTLDAAPACTATVNVGDVSTGTSAFTLVKMIERGAHYEGPLVVALAATDAPAGSVVVSAPGTYKYEVAEGCWGTFNVEDKTGPVCVASPDDLPNIFVSGTFKGDLKAKFEDASLKSFDDCSTMKKESLFYTDEKLTLCPGETVPTKDGAELVLPAAADGWSVCEVLIRKHFIADWAGNVSAESANCTQYLYVLRPTVTFPEMNVTGILDHDDDCKPNFELCANPFFQDLPEVGFWGTGEKVELSVNNHEYKYAYSVVEGDKIYTCTDKDPSNTATYKQVRALVLIDWCTGEKLIGNQLIEVKDTTAPVITVGTATEWSNPYDCNFEVKIGASSAWDCVGSDMTGTINVVVAGDHANYSGGSFASYTFDPAVGTTIPNVPAGATLEGTITAWDGCGNQSTTPVKYVVKGSDDYAPICVANDELEVSLIKTDAHDNTDPAGHQVGTRVYPEDIDDTSRDNCAIASMEIRKAAKHVVGGNTSLKDDEGWADFIEYSYTNEEFAKIAGDKCQVEMWVDLKVTDANGNYSICPSRLILRDNTPATISKIGMHQTYGCLDHNAPAAGGIEVWGNCYSSDDASDNFTFHCPVDATAAINKVVEITKDLIEDLSGKVLTDAEIVALLSENMGGLPALGNLWINSVDVVAYDVVKKTEHGASHDFAAIATFQYSEEDETFVFPQDFKVECSSNGIPDASKLSDILTNRGCSEWVMNVTEKTFLGAEDACYKIIRNYEFINWCRWDENLTNDNTQINKDCADKDNDGKILGDERVAISAKGVHGQTYTNGIYNGESYGCNEDESKLGYRYDSDVVLLRQGYFNYTQVIKVSDSEAPEGDIDVKIACDGTIDACHQGVVTFEVSATDDCSGVANFVSYELIAETTYGAEVAEKFTRDGDVVSAAGLPLGKYTLKALIEDACGNSIWLTETATVEESDCKKPTVIGYANFTALMENCTVDIWLSDILASSSDNCTEEYGAWTYGIELANNGVADPDVMPTDTVVRITTAGGNQVALWMMDGAGNTQYTIVPVVAQDNAGTCGSGTEAGTASVIGNIVNENNEDIDQVTVSVKGTDMVDFTSIFDGSFNVASVPMHSDVTIAADKNVGHLNGVSTADLVLLQRHVLGISTLNSAYKIIAADANNDTKIDTRDMLHISRLVLGIYDELPSNNSWRFVAKSHTFANPTSPWGFAEAIDFQNLEADAQADFIGVKIGDLTGNAVASKLLGTDDTKVGAMTIAIDNATIAAGETATIEFTTSDFNNFAGYQFSIALDSRVAFNGISAGTLEGVTDANFGLSALESGVITTNWSNVEGVSVENGTVMFSLTVTASEAVNVSEILAVNSAVTSAEAYNADLDVHNVNVQFNRAANAGFELFQNTPNPVSGETVIGFNLPTAGAATLKVMDVAGRTIAVRSNDFAAGYNTITLNKSDLNTTGVLYYQLDTENNSATKKMVILE